MTQYLEHMCQIFQSYYPLNEESLHTLRDIAKVETYKKGTIMLSIGKVATHLHVLCKGAAVAYFMDEKGNSYHKNIFLEGSFVGSTVSLLKKTPSEFTLEIIEDSVVCTLPFQDYRMLIETNLDFKNFYIAYLEKNWVMEKEKREVGLVMKHASQRYTELLEEHPNIDKRISLHYIASHLGITPTQLSRIRKELKKS